MHVSTRIALPYLVCKNMLALCSFKDMRIPCSHLQAKCLCFSILFHSMVKRKRKNSRDIGISRINPYKPSVVFYGDIGKQNSPRYDAIKRSVPSGAIPFDDMIFIEK